MPAVGRRIEGRLAVGLRLDPAAVGAQLVALAKPPPAAAPPEHEIGPHLAAVHRPPVDRVRSPAKLAQLLAVRRAVGERATQNDALRRSALEIRHLLPRLFLGGVDDPAALRRRVATILDLEPPAVAADLVAFAQPPLVLGPPHQQRAVRLVRVRGPPVGRADLR